MKQYARRDIVGLDKAGNYYCRHVGAMTAEGLHSKADIAAELAWRDEKIDRLENRITEVLAALRDRDVAFDRCYDDSDTVQRRAFDHAIDLVEQNLAKP